MRKYFHLLFFVFVLMFFSCDVLTPNIEKSKTEKKQLETQKEMVELYKKEIAQLKRIADALEELANSQQKK